MAFIPHPLPPRIDLNLCMVDVDRASRAMAELKGMSYKVANPLHLINPLQRREALASSSIEGTYATATDLLLFEASHGSAGAKPDTRKVHNYVAALQEGLSLLNELPISFGLIKRVHAVLLRDVKRHRRAKLVPGEYKRDQNLIWSRTLPIEEARFVLAPPTHTEALMGDLETFINSEEARALPPVIVNALIHYQFETIHPFPDGNGRVGRLLLPLILAAERVMPMPLLYISPFIQKHKDEYNNAMLEVSKTGAWEAWICYFAQAIEISAIETMRKIDEIAQLRDQFAKEVQQARASGRLLALIDLVFDKLAVSVPEAAARLGVTFQTAKHNIDKLIDVGILSSLRARRPKLFLSPALFRLVFEVEAPAAPVEHETSGRSTDDAEPALL
jgi:Fic family protein